MVNLRWLCYYAYAMSQNARFFMALCFRNNKQHGWKFFSQHQFMQSSLFGSYINSGNRFNQSIDMSFQHNVLESMLDKHENLSDGHRTADLSATYWNV
eukprot:3736976-Amphidinium_carterae.1